MKLAYLSPLPPVPSGVSEYSAELLPALGRHAELRLFAAPPAAGGEVAGLAVEAPERFDGSEFDLAVYHMGNNVHHRFVYQRAARRPGLLVLHDLVLHHFHSEETIGRGQPAAYERLMHATYGERGAEVATANVHEISSELSFFQFPLFEPLAAASRGVLVHNQRAASLVRERVAGVPVAMVPMGMPLPEADPLPERDQARRLLGIDAGSFVVGIFGFTTPMKRPEVALRAFARLAARLPAARLVIVGEVSRIVDLAGPARELGIARLLTCTGYLPYAEVKRWVAAADAFVNLRYPTAGETSASLLRLLGWGKPVVVSDYAQFRELPLEVAPRVAPGAGEVEALAGILAELAARPDRRAALGARAAAHVRRRHRLEDAAAGYEAFAAELIERGAAAAGRVRPLPTRRTSRTPRRPLARLSAAALPGMVRPGERMALRVRASNEGDTLWLAAPPGAPGSVSVGARLRQRGTSAAEAVIGRVALDRDVAPGGWAEVALELAFPAELVGHVDLVVDLEVAGWGWLGRRGSEALVYRLDAGRRPARLLP